MKVVLFCGGLGTRLRDYSETVPKPMVPIGPRPILWHVMKYYAHFGHKDFILCLGYRGNVVKDYFLHYDETISNDFVLSNGTRDVSLMGSDLDDWRITFVDTGLHANIGQRLKSVQRHLEGEEFFLANYADGLTDLDLNLYIDFALDRRTVASFVAVRPPLSFHLTRFDQSGRTTHIEPIRDSDIWVNAGYFVLRPEIFNELDNGEELVIEPFQRLIKRGELSSYGHEGFWMAMDTFKDKQALESLYERGPAPWELWRQTETRT